MNGSLFPSSGKLLYRESDVAAMSYRQLREMRRKIGSIYQQHYLVAGMSVLANTLSGALGRWGMASTLRNLASPSAVEVERAEHCLEPVGLADKRRFRCEQLSGGQQQRLAIARTLMQEPEVILADEPVASLDPVLSNEILELLVRLTEEAKLTLLISLHQVDLALAAQQADRGPAMRRDRLRCPKPGRGSALARAALSERPRAYDAASRWRSIRGVRRSFAWRRVWPKGRLHSLNRTRLGRSVATPGISCGAAALGRLDLRSRSARCYFPADHGRHSSTFSIVSFLPISPFPS